MKSKEVGVSAPSSAAAGGAPHRAYTKPKLSAYGPLAKLTRSQQSGAGEGIPTAAMRMCL